MRRKVSLVEEFPHLRAAHCRCGMPNCKSGNILHVTHGLDIMDYKDAVIIVKVMNERRASNPFVEVDLDN